ncbi:regulator of microtubule dynamics protein 2 isoform X2 [Pygocentrus nattereri]|uniref:Regulator of microtubule dynamics protein 2 n=2 Tax=Pygocentrus nattereri TaxID=42514 RepID=A0A3B4DWV2_PYGNA|nr:regulator of microtubule dynamics protein 2 isoform X2 [Pygocentrus nattereri]XP_037394578.1 regulator of microtubule dynamics protein 2 isoform X2 [Pygocentrus nattereri]XP_037394579.1 regulator of microtubule dynamics protein 2 isoform X2 [Pygocentrus nattereri]
MAQADGKVLALGVLAGAAGISLAAAWYQSRRAVASSAGTGTYHPGLYTRSNAGSVALQGGQAEVLDRLGALIQCVSELKEEVKALKETLPHLQDHVRDELRGRIGARKASPLNRTTPTRRKRASGVTRAEGQSSEEAESEGGYMTALTDSEEEDRKAEEPLDDLTALLRRADGLHECKGDKKKQGLSTLLEKKEKFDQKCQYLWRLTRAYADAHDLAGDSLEKKKYAEKGKQIGAQAISVNPVCAESHQWYAILCGLLSEYESVQSKIKNGYLFKDHLDIAIKLKPQDPLSYYLLGRWCYAVAQCTWIERKIAATLFGEPPSSTIQDALQNFLKAEELCPKYSKFNYVFLAKCYKDLGQKTQAKKMCESASAMSIVTKEDEEAQKELASLLLSL